MPAVNDGTGCSTSWSRREKALLFILFAACSHQTADATNQTKPASGPAETVDNAVAEVEVITGEQDAKWRNSLTLPGGDSLLNFTKAVSGKDTKQSTRDLLNGVIEVNFLDEGLMFKRCDNAQLLISRHSKEGEKLEQDWEKAKRNAEKQFGSSGRAFLSSIKTIRRLGDRIEVIRSDNNLLVEVGKKKLHHAFDLKAIKFENINLTLGEIRQKPALIDIDGVTVMVNAPGITLPVHVKQFCKWKNEKGDTDITVGIKSPVPAPLRAVLFLPKVVVFNFVLPKRKDDKEETSEPKPPEIKDFKQVDDATTSDTIIKH